MVRIDFACEEATDEGVPVRLNQQIRKIQASTLGGFALPILLQKPTDQAKLEALEAVRAAIRLGMTGDEAKIAVNSSRGEAFVSNIATDRWL